MTDLEIEGIGPATLIGGGGSATVFAATRSAYGDRVAVKVLKQTLTDTDAQRHFRREVRALQELAEAPGIVAVLDSGLTARQEPYLVLPLFASSAQESVEQGSPMEWKRATRLIADAADAVAHAHQQGIFHRDIKPANLLLTQGDDVFVTDFGIAVLTDSSMSAANWLAFTPGYAPPEAFDGAAPSAAWDVYSLGASLAALISGRAPFEVTEQESLLSIVRRITDEPPPDLRHTGAPDALAAFVERCMEKSPTDRPASAAAVAAELRALLHEREPGTAESGRNAPATELAAVAAGRGSTHVDHDETPPITRPPGSTRSAGPEASPEGSIESSDRHGHYAPGHQGRWLAWTAAALAIAAVVAGVLMFGRGDDPIAVDTESPEPTPATAAVSSSTTEPTSAPTAEPAAPAEPTLVPTAEPAAPAEPTLAPTAEPSPVPSVDPTPAADQVIALSVGADGAGDPAALFEAVAAVADGGEIQLGAGTWIVDDTVLIDRPITLSGAGAGTTELQTTSAATVLLVANTTAEVRDLGVVGVASVEPTDRLPLIVVENADVTIDGVEVSGSWGDGIFVFDGRGTITTVSAEDNRWSGIAFGGSSDVTLTDTVARRNGTGLAWLESATGRAEGNTAEDNEGAGFAAEGTAAPELTGNTATDNADGFQWSGEATGSLVGNHSEANEFAAYLFTDGSSPDVRNNTAVAEPGGEGLVVDAGASPTLDGNSES